MKENFLKFSFSLPVYNEEKRIKRCLDSIKMQDYPQDRIEVLLADGGSSDRTVEIASQYEFVRVSPNPRKLADFGAKINAKEATGDLFVIFAADNELADRDWLKIVNNVFLYDQEVSTLWCKMISSLEDSPLNRYYELIQNDPLSFFVNKNLRYYLERAFLRKFNGKNCYIFNVDKNKPLIWGANGLVYRTSWVREIILREGFVADNDVFQILIEGGKNKVAYLEDLYVYHHHIKSLKQWRKKWKRNFLEHFLTKRHTRNLGWIMNKNFKWKLLLWMVYSIIPLFSFIHSVYLSFRRRNIYWLYHSLASFYQAVTYSWLVLSNVEGKKAIRELFYGGKL